MELDTDFEIVALGQDPTSVEVAAVADLARAVQADDRPEDPPVGDAEVAGKLRYGYPQHHVHTVIARRGEQLVGRVRATLDERPANKGFTELDVVEVHPDHRRRGVATALVRAAVAHLHEQGSTTVMAWPHDDGGRALCDRLGMTMRQLERQSRLRVGDVDRALMEQWVEAPSARAAGYRVMTFRQPVPDEVLDAWIAAKDAMADAPLDDVEWSHDPVTPEWVRSVEAMHEARGMIGYGSLALDADGNGAGMSWILLHPERPQLAHQEDTAVVPAHRGFSLGRWLKAANLLQLLDAHPEVEIVETYNAETNGPMLDINVAMGFRPSRTYFAYQAPVPDVVARLGVVS